MLLTDVVFAFLIVLLGLILCPFFLIFVVLTFGWFTLKKLSDRLIKKQKWHSCPCPQCYYFNHCPQLPCAVNPQLVLTKNACSCVDFKPTLNNKTYNYKYYF